MSQPQQIQARQVAHIANVKDILSGKFVKEDGWNPNYVVIGESKVSRANVIGTIINVKNEENMQFIELDDGTGKITLRNFEKKFDVEVGNIVLCIGRVRQYENEIYLSPEIINKNINRGWSKVWKKIAIVPSEIIEEKNEEPEEEIEEERVNETDLVIVKIKELDKGDGASYEDIISIIKDEKIISKLLLQGEIFEIKPGKLKVLE